MVSSKINPPTMMPRTARKPARLMRIALIQSARVAGGYPEVSLFERLA